MKVKRKQIMCIVWATVLIFFALPFAFGGGQKETAAGGAASTKTLADVKGATINVMAVQMPQLEPYWKIVPQFEQKYGVKVVIDETPFDQNRQKSLLEMSKKSGRYDVFNIDCMWLAEYAAAGYLEPLMKYIKNPNLTEADFDVNDFVPRIFSGNGVYNDVVYSIPMGAGTMGQSWRTDIAKEYGLTFPTKWPDWTTDKMLDYAKKLNHPEKGYAGYVTQPRRFEWGWTFIQLMMTFASKDRIGNEYLDKNWKVTIDNPDNLAALKWYLSLRPYTPEGSANFGYDEVTTTFQQGRAAGSVNYSSWIFGQQENPAVSKAAGKSAHLHTPVGPGGRIDPFFGSWGIGISSGSKNKDAAWAFIQWITSKSVQRKAIASGAVPVRISTYTSAETKQYMPWYVPLYDFFTNYANPDERVRIPEWGELSDIMGLYGNEAWTNQITPEQALASMQRDMTKVMDTGGYYNASVQKPKQEWRNLSWYDGKPGNWQ